MTNFIFMLTHHDVTIRNAMDVFEEIKDTGLKYIGCKNIGLSDEELRQLVNSMKKEGMKTFMEVVSYEKEESMKVARKADELGMDYLIGGMPFLTEMMTKFMREEDIKVKYFPYSGEIVDHPCLLKGSIDHIINDAKRTVKLGVAGINLLAYRHRGEDPHELLRRFKETIDIPTVVAGDVNNFERIREIVRLGYWGFTIGGAILEKKFVPKESLRDQIIAVLDAVENVKI